MMFKIIEGLPPDVLAIEAVLTQLVGLRIEVLLVGRDTRVGEYLPHRPCVQNTKFKANE